MAEQVEMEEQVNQSATGRRRNVVVAFVMMLQRNGESSDNSSLSDAFLDIGALQEQEEDATDDCCKRCYEAVSERCCEISTSRIGTKGFASVVKSKSLRKAGEIGRKKIKEKVFPLFSDHAREIWSYLVVLST